MIRRIGRNDPTLTKLRINKETIFDNDEYESYSGNDFMKLGESIGNNTHIKVLCVLLHDDGDDVSDMVDGLKQNTSIRELGLWSNTNNPEAGVRQLFEMYQKKNSLTTLSIQYAIIHPISQVINNALRLCTNLKHISFGECNMTDNQLLPIVQAIKGHPLLEVLNLYGNSIGNVGCHALATLLEDPKCNIHTLNLINNRIGNIGAKYLANGLNNNTSLKHLDLVSNNPLHETDRIDDNTIHNIFCPVLLHLCIHKLAKKVDLTQYGRLCPTLACYANHTLERLYVDCDKSGDLTKLLNMNSNTNKHHVAMKKILMKHQGNIVVKPLFGWDASGEKSLKSLPYLVSWYETAEAVVEYYISDSDDDSSFEGEEEKCYDIDRKKLSSIFDYAKSMPLLFVPPSGAKEHLRKSGLPLDFYERGIVTAIAELKDRTGSSSNDIKKYLQASFLNNNYRRYPFLDSTYLSALKEVVADGDIINTKGFYKLSSDKLPTRVIPPSYTVSGAGCNHINGRYDKIVNTAWLEFAGRDTTVPMYQKKIAANVTDSEWAGKTITLFKCTTRNLQQQWFLSEVDREQPGTDKDIDYYRVNSHVNKLPSTSGWSKCSSGVDPPPTLEAKWK